MVSVSTLLTALAIFFVGGLECAFNGIAGNDSFGHLVAVLRGSDDGDIGFGRDVVANVTLRDVSVQVVLTMICRLTGPFGPIM